MVKAITSYSLYRFRYWIGYSLIGLTLIGALLYAGLFVPGGISQGEMSSVITSSDIKPVELSSYAVLNLPYHMLQKISMYLFGVTPISIKLPSLVLAFFAAIGLLLLLRMWFKRNIAVLGSIIAVTTGQFLFVAQSGTPEILYIFWSVLLLLLGILVSKQTKLRTLWKMLFFITVALSLYTPLGIYALIVIALASVLHPHLRYVLKQLSKVRLLIAVSIAAIIIAPLAYGIFTRPELALDILGIPNTWPDWGANAQLLFQQYFGFMTPSTTALMTPVFGLGSMLIIALGIYRTIKSRESTQGYTIIIWLLCLIPIILINPSYTSITFLPLVLLLCMGLESLLGYWYGLFPLNPYARIAGLLPLIILVGSLVLSGIDRYVGGYAHDPSTASNFSNDLSLIPKDTKHLVVSSSQLPFYSVVAKYNKNILVDQTPLGETFTTTGEAARSYPDYEIARIVTSPHLEDSNSFYVYVRNSL